MRSAALVLSVSLVASCANGAPERREATRARQAPTPEGRGAAGAPDPTTTSGDRAPAVSIPIGLDRRVADPATSDFEAVVKSTLLDSRGWQRAGFEFVFAGDARFRVVLAEGDVVDALCFPYDTGGRFSCQLGEVVALNADRWRGATPQWTGDLATYRQMLVNHEVGHLLGQHHPQNQCPAPGEPAPVMSQQSTELHGCRPNPWPLDWEIACAARHADPVAPGYEPDVEPTCGPRG